MLNRVVGDTVILESNIKDNDGTAITTAIGSLTIIDGQGSTVLATNATHVSAGTYQRKQNTTGWGNGPVTEVWKFFDSAGTLTKIINNNFRIIGTDTVKTYVDSEELPAYYENITDYFDGNEEAEVVNAYWDVNARLEALGHKLPFKPKADGFYDQPLRDLNAYEAIYRLVLKRQSSLRKDEEEPWYEIFREYAGSIYQKIERKIYSFDRDYSPSEGGVGTATKTSGTSSGQLDTNWRGGVGNGFSDSSYERTWLVKINDIATTAEIGSTSFVWSNNGGMSWVGTKSTSLEWQELQDGVFVRFHRGTYTGGTTALFAVNDQWQFKTFPRGQTVGGKRTAVSY